MNNKSPGVILIYPISYGEGNIYYVPTRHQLFIISFNPCDSAFEVEIMFSILYRQKLSVRKANGSP